MKKKNALKFCISLRGLVISTLHPKLSHRTLEPTSEQTKNQTDVSELSLSTNRLLFGSTTSSVMHKCGSLSTVTINDTSPCLSTKTHPGANGLDSKVSQTRAQVWRCRCSSRSLLSTGVERRNFSRKAFGERSFCRQRAR